MHLKQKLTYMGFGGLLVLAGYILASLANYSVAQSGAQDVTFGTITCRQLEVVDDEGNKSVGLTNNVTGGAVVAYGKDGSQAVLRNDKYGGVVVAHGKGEDGGSASLTNNEHGGSVWATGKNGGYVRLTNNEHGGDVVASGKDGGAAQLSNSVHGGILGATSKDGSSASLGVDEHGGVVSVWGQSGGVPGTMAGLSNKEHGYQLYITNNGTKNVLQAGVGDDGGGIITTRDKLGYRTGRLP